MKADTSRSAPRKTFLIIYTFTGLAFTLLTSVIFMIYEPAFLKDYLAGCATCFAACFLARKVFPHGRGNYIDISKYTISTSLAASGLAILISSFGIILKLGSGTPVFLFVVPATLGGVAQDLRILLR
ncbi:hypothetical protein [Burkholderia stagnalis]|uniref:hypothetical protein n=1 Tax=Burkholderia stagnalis TaxID=1503054 RepID=UPI0012D89FF1|nr:hypothetical protein [Burkholderia stagnalis]